MLLSPTLLLVVSVVLKGVFTANRSQFLTCRGTAFCSRYRSYVELKVGERSQEGSWSVDAFTVSEKGFLNINLTKQQPSLTRLCGQVQLLDSGAFRLVVNELSSKGQIDLLDSIISSSQTVPILRSGGGGELFKSYSESSNSIQLEWIGVLPELYMFQESYISKPIVYTLEIDFKPFRIKLFHDKHLAVIINGQQLLYYESDADRPRGQLLAPPDEPFTATGLDISYSEADAFLGLAEHATSLDLPSEFPNALDKDEPYRFWNSDVSFYELESPMALYAAVPYLHTVAATNHASPSRVVGTLWINGGDTFVKLDRSERGNWIYAGENGELFNMTRTWWTSETGVIDLIITGGHSLLDTTRSYHRITGLPAQQQLSTLGLHQSRWNYNTQEDVEYVSEKYDQHSIPLDYIWLDIDYSSKRQYLTWNENFPDPQKMTDFLAERKRNLVVILDPHLKINNSYFLYEVVSRRNLTVKSAEKTPFEGECWPGLAVYPDVFLPETRQAFSELLLSPEFRGGAPSKSRYRLPSHQFADWENGFTRMQLWTDMSEPSVFDGPEMTIRRDALHLNAEVQHGAVHNLYGLYFSRAVYEAALKRDEGRPFLLTRSGFIGSHRYSAVWTGDNQASWEHARMSVAMVLNLALGGWSFSGADIGGFFGEPSPELLTRWVQLGMWLPFARIHSTRGSSNRELYTLPLAERQATAQAVLARYRLLPFWYTLLMQHSLFALPILSSIGDFELRVNPHAQLSSKTSLSRSDGFIVGDTFFVRPVLVPEAQKIDKESIFTLPGNLGVEWWHFESRTWVGKGGQELTLPNITYFLPAYVQGGSIVATKERQRRSSEAMRFDPFTLNMFVNDGPNSGEIAQGMLYLDDYKSMSNFIDGEYAWIRFFLERKSVETVEFHRKIFLFEHKKSLWKWKLSTTVERIRITGLQSSVKGVFVGSATSKIESSNEGKTQTFKIEPPLDLLDDTWSLRLLHVV